MASFIKISPIGSRLSITSTNLDEFLIQYIDIAEASAEGFSACLVQPRHVLAALYLAGDEVEIKQEKSGLVIQSAATVKVKTADADEFPAIPDYPLVGKKEAPCVELAAGIKAVQFCAHNNPARAELCSIHFQSDSGKMVVEATDGANGAFHQFDWAGELSFLVSAEHSSRLAEAFSMDGAELFLTGNLVAVKHKLGSYACKLLEAKYPNTSAMRNGEKFSAKKPLGTINAECVTDTLSAALMLCDANQLPAMTVEFTPKAIQFKSDSFHRGLDGKFEKHSTKVNAQALKKCFSAFGSEMVNIGTGELDFIRLESGKLSVLTMSLREA